MLDITNHALLTPEAVAKVAASGEWGALAEDLLGLADLSLSAGSEAEARAMRAVVLQVNLMVEQGVEAAAYQSVSRGARSWQHRSGGATSGGSMIAVDPRARALADSVRGTGAWSTVRSARG